MTLLQSIAAGNIPAWFILVFVAVIIWSGIWKLLALWKSARRKDLVWFIILGIVNTLGILEILYIYVFSKDRKITRVNRKR